MFVRAGPARLAAVAIPQPPSTHPSESPMNARPPVLPALSVSLAAFLLASCSSLYYKTMEMFGSEKRDILVDRVEDARDGQEAAKEQFRTALERFKDVASVQGGDLETKYDGLKAEFDRSEAKANDVHNRIAKIEEVAGDLFAEWDEEIGEMSEGDLRKKSTSLRMETQGRYEQMLTAMKTAETKMTPVLSAFKDQTLYLKHNLNAKAISSLQENLVTIQTDVESLIQGMEKSIDEANKFIGSMEQPAA
jgi:hypothetical protein